MANSDPEMWNLFRRDPERVFSTYRQHNFDLDRYERVTSTIPQRILEAPTPEAATQILLDTLRDEFDLDLLANAWEERVAK